MNSGPRIGLMYHCVQDIRAPQSDFLGVNSNCVGVVDGILGSPPPINNVVSVL